MNKTVLSFVVLALGLVISAVFVMMALSVGKYGVDYTKSAMLQTQQAISVVDDDFAEVKASSIPGNSVATLLQKFDGSGYKHLVVTAGCSKGFYGADGVNDVHSDYYVNPKKSFSGSVVMDENENVYAVKFVEHGVEDVEFSDQEAAKVGKSLDSKVQDEQYVLFKKFLRNRGKCNSYLQWCSQYADKLQDLNDAQMRYIYTKYSGDISNQEEYLAYQVLSFDMQLNFFKEVESMVKVWTEAKWFEAILTTEYESSENLPEYDPGNEGDDDDDDKPWWEEPEETDPDHQVNPGDSNISTDTDKSNNGTESDGDAIYWTPEPTLEPTLEPAESPGESAGPIVTPAPEPSEEPTLPVVGKTENPGATESPGDTTVEIRGPDA